MIETINEALVACVKACGGSKVVGVALWPEKPALAAQRLLLDCLNEDRPQQLAPEQAMFVFRLARDRGCHAGMSYLSQALSYSMPTPVEPEDEAAMLKRQFIAATQELARMAQRIEQIERPGLRSAA
jgi:hypothetical protein